MHVSTYDQELITWYNIDSTKAWHPGPGQENDSDYCLTVIYMEQTCSVIWNVKWRQDLPFIYIQIKPQENNFN